MPIGVASSHIRSLNIAASPKMATRPFATSATAPCIHPAIGTSSAPVNTQATRGSSEIDVALNVRSGVPSNWNADPVNVATDCTSAVTGWSARVLLAREKMCTCEERRHRHGQLRPIEGKPVAELRAKGGRQLGRCSGKRHVVCNQ